MRRAQVIIYETDDRITQLLRAHGAKCGWWLRPVRNPNRIVSLLRPGEASVVILKTGRDLEREFAVLERISRAFPDAATIVVGDADQPALAGLAWDLGARFVLFPPQPREQLPEIVKSLMGNHE
jgi:DNA-binding NarL/FixJ family response regulator